jgi:hypothetical protein
VLVARLDIDTDPETILWRKKSLVVSDANVESIKILLGPGVNVGGRIRIEGKTNLDVGNRKATLEPREGVTVNSLIPAVENASINPDGTFTFHHVPEGTYNKGGIGGVRDGSHRRCRPCGSVARIDPQLCFCNL